MKKFRLKISGQDFDKLQRLVLADMPREAAAFALAGIANLKRSTDVIVRRIIEIPKEFLDYQDEYHLRIKPQAVNGLIALSESNGLSAVLCHSHAEGLTYSPSDDYGERRIVKAIQPSVPPGIPIASLLISPNGVNGRIWLPNTGRPIPISEIVVLDSSLRHIWLTQATQPVEINEIYDRQVRAFGAVGQEMITQAKVAVIGIGGTGSPVAEQLVRLGVKDLVLIDPDKFDPSNVTRVYGTFSSSITRLAKGQLIYKIEQVASNLKKINPKATIRAISKNIVLTEAAINILDRDVVFLCTDEHWGRSIGNQLAYQYFIPVINLGARIASKGGEIMAAVGTVDIIRPDKPCLWCSQFLKADRITAESIPFRDRPKLQQEGYVENLETKTPSVVSITTTVAGMAVTMFLQLITDFMGISGNISRLNYNVMDGTVRRGTTTVSTECICRKVRGFGDLMPLPTLSNLDYLNS
jgi:hypothetical protein